MGIRCANCDVELDVTRTNWFFKSIACCSESCAREYSRKIKN